MSRAESTIYAQLDAMIIAKLSDKPAELIYINASDVRDECMRLAGSSRDAYRVIDGRMQALKRKKLIRFVSATGGRGWVKA
jgi:hypothetical protein